MADKKIPALPAGVALSGNELFESVQAGVSVKIPSNYFALPDYPYITVGNVGLLTESRQLAAGSGISLVDGGAGGSLTVTATGVAVSDATFVLLSANAGLPNERVLTGTASQVIVTDNGAGSTVVLSTPQNIATTSSPTFSNLTLANPLPTTSGGTGIATYTLGDSLYSSAANVLSKLAGNVTTTKLFLTQTGTGAVSAAPAWATIAASDLPGSFAGFGNPTASIGLSVVNGSATTAMRSDGAPPLDQAIAPTWTGQHIWSLALRGPAGAVGTPAFTFSTDTNTGIYSVGADDLGIATNGVLRLDVSTTAITSTLQQLAQAGTAAAPAYSFSADPNTGLYSVGADNAGLSTNGVLRWDISTTAITSTLQRLGQAGTASAPAYSFSSDPNTGVYSVGADDLGLATNGILRWDISTTAITSTLQRLGQDGTAAAPAFSFSSDPNTGTYSVGADDWGVATGGTLRFDISTTAITSTLPFRGADGSAAAPEYSFSGDTDTGLYRIGANQLGLSLGGTLLWNFQTTGIDTASAVQFRLADGSAATPIYSFGSDTNTGAYRRGSDQYAIATGGVDALILNSAQQATFGAQVFTGDGTASVPAWTFSADGDTGMYRNGANEFSAIAGTTFVMAFGVSRILGGVPYFGPDGAAGAPSYSFNSDQDTGVYLIGANNPAIVAGGSRYFEASLGSNFATVGLNSSTELRINAVTDSTASAGAATLPANPVAFLDVTINGTVRKIPYYAS